MSMTNQYSTRILKDIGRAIRTVGFALSVALAGTAAGALLAAVVAPAVAAVPAATSVQQSVPTTRILAIGTLTPKAADGSLRTALPDEVKQTVQLYLSGKLDQWYVKQDQTGVVFILNVTNIDEAREMLERLPLGRAGLMTFELTPLGPLRPLSVLLDDHH